MSLQRKISWTAALRDMHADRAVVPAGFLSARARCQGFSRFRQRPLAVAGKFDRSAIMAAAAAAAKAHQERHGGSWQAAMAVCLKASWQAAKMARNAAAH